MTLTTSEIAIVLKAYDQASTTIHQVEASTNNLGSAFGRVTQNALGVAAGIAAIAGAGSALQALGSVVVGFNAKMETSAASWKTFTGSAEAAQAVLIQVQQIAATTPFEFEDVDKAAKRFVNAGMSAQGALDYVLPLANAVASVGLGAVGVDRVSLALSQMTQKGKVSGQEMLQLTEAQIPAWDILAQATGKPIPELQKLVEQGKITAQQYTDAFAVYYGATGKFRDAAADQSKTLAGSMSTIRDQLNIVGSTAFKPIFDVLSSLAQAFAKFVQSDAFVVWGGKVQAVVGLVVEGVGMLYGAFATSLGGILDLVSTVGQAIYGALQWINPFAAHSEPLVSQVEDGVAAIKTAYGSLGTVSGTFDTVRTSFESLSGVTARFTSEFGDDLPTKVEHALQIMGPGAVAAFMEASAAVDVARVSVAEIKDEWDAATIALVPLKDALDGAKDSLKDQQSTLSDLRSTLSEAKASYDPLNEQLKAVQQNAKDAEQAIKDLTNAPLAGSAEFEKKIADSNIAIKQQALSLGQVKQSTAYQSLGEQIDTAAAKLKEMQRTQATFIPGLAAGASDSQRKAHTEAVERNRVLADQSRTAISQQQAALDVLKDKQKDLLDPAQKELDKRRELLATIQLEKDATIGVAQERIKSAAAGALGIKEQTEAQITAAIEAARIARESALGQAATLAPTVKAQQDAIKGIEDAIRAQDRAVSDAQKTVDSANVTYSDAKQLVDDLGTSYRSGKAEIAGYDQQLKQLIQTGELQVQKAGEAKKAADTLAKSGSATVTAKVDVLKGLDIEGSKAKIKAFSDQVASTRAQITGNLDALRSKWDSSWSAVKGVFDRLLAGFGGFNAIKPALDFLGRFAGIAAGVSAALVLATPLIGMFGAALAPIGALIGLALTPIGLLVVGIAALTAAWTLNVGNIQQSAAGLAQAFAPLEALPDVIRQAVSGDVMGALAAFVDDLSTTRTNIVELLAGWGAAFIGWLLPQIPELSTQLTAFATKVIDWVLAQGDKYLKTLLKWGSAFVDWLLPVIPDLLKMLDKVALGLIQWIRNEGKTIAGRLGEWAAKFLEWVIPLIPKIGPALEQIATAVIKFITEGAPIVLGALADWAGAFLDWVLPVAKDMLEPLAELLGGLTKWIVEEGAQLIGKALLDWGAAFLGWIGPRIDPMLKEADKLANELGNWILKRAPEVLAQLGLWGSAFVNWIKEKVIPFLSPQLDKLINGGDGFVGIVPWIEAQAKVFPEALGFWTVTFLLWVDDVVKGMPDAMVKITNSIVAWVKTEGAAELGKAGVLVGEAIIRGILLGIVAPFLISKAILDQLPEVVRGVQRGLGASVEDRLPQGGLPASAQPTPSDLLTNPRGRAAPITSRDIDIVAGLAAGGTGAAARVSQFSDKSMSFEQAAAICGPAAALAFANVNGLYPTLAQATAIAAKTGWTQADGMAGVDSEMALLERMGLTGTLTRNPTAAQIAQGAGSGSGAILSTSKHYFTAAGGDTNALNVGTSGSDLIGQGTTMSLDAIGSWNGGKGVTAMISDIHAIAESVTDLQLPLVEYGQTISRFEADNLSGGRSLDALAAQTGKARGSYLELATSAQSGFGATVDAAAMFANQFGITLEQADRIIQDHGSVARTVMATDVPGSFEITDLAVERFADVFKLTWTEARRVLEAGGDAANLVMGKQIPAAVQTSVEAVASLGENKLWQAIDSNAAIAGRSLKTYLQESGAGAIDVATASLADLKKASGLTFPQMQAMAEAAGKDLKTWLQDTGVPAAQAFADSLGLVNVAVGDLATTLVVTGNPAIDSFNAALAKIPDQAKAAAQAYRDLVTAMDNNQASSGPGGSLRQAASEAADIGVHSVTAASGLISTLAKSYAQMSDAEKEAANRFANAGGSSSGGGGGGSSPFPDHIGESGPGGKYNDPSTGKPYTRAGGGPVSAGQLYRVNEAGMHGVELFMPSMNGSISPRGGGSSGGGGIDYDRLGAAVARAIQNMPAPRVALEDVRSGIARIGGRNGGVAGLA